MDNPIILGLSLLLNMIQSVVLYFKSGLNKILERWWQQRQALIKAQDSAIEETHRALIDLENLGSQLLELTKSLSENRPAAKPDDLRELYVEDTSELLEWDWKDAQKLDQQIESRISYLKVQHRGLPKGLRNRLSELEDQCHPPFIPQEKTNLDESMRRLQQFKIKIMTLRKWVARKYPRKVGV